MSLEAVLPPLASRACVPCRGGTPPLTATETAPLLAQLDGWSVVDQHHLLKCYRRADFRSALALVDRIGAMAEEQNHHPDIHLSWGRVEVTIWTHKIHGLTESDFVFAARCDVLADEASG